MTTSAYFTFLESVLSHLNNQSIPDYGVMTYHSRRRLVKALYCKHNPLCYPPSAYPCQVCEVCRGNQVYQQFKKIEKTTFSPLVHDYYSVGLSLPKWPVGIPVIDGCRNFGELFFVTERLFDPDKTIPLNSVLSGLRSVGKDSIQKCFPEMKLGMFFALHLVNGYMAFSPHFHAILCGTALAEDYWPLVMDQNGEFPELGQAWRSVLGGRHGISVRVFRRQLQEHWAGLLSEYCIQVFQQYRAGFLPSGTFCTSNIAFQIINGMTVEAIQAMKDTIYQAVLSDPACVYVKPIGSDSEESEGDPTEAYKRVVEYDVARPFKNIEFRDLGGGMSSAHFVKDGERKFVGDFSTLTRRMLQYFSVYRVRRYQMYGLLHGGHGKAKHSAFVAAMNRGYPR